MANPEYFECFMNGRIHHRRHDSKEWKVGYAPRGTTLQHTAAPIKTSIAMTPARSTSDLTSNGATFDDAPSSSSDLTSNGATFDDAPSSSSDVSGGGGAFDGGGASGDY